MCIERARRSGAVLATIALCGLCATRPEAREAAFIRGDANASTRIELADALTVLRRLFQGGGSRPCLDAMDANDDGAIDLTDAVYLLLHLFLGGAPPPPPFPDCAGDPTGDELGCERHGTCARLVIAPLVEEAGAVVLVIDRSGTMQDSGELTLARIEAFAWLADVPPGIEFAILLVDKGVVGFPATPSLTSTGDPLEVRRAESFLEQVTGGIGSCVQDGLLAALERASASDASRKAIVFLTDGTATCPGSSSEAEYIRQTLERLEVENVGRVPIHVVGIGPFAPIHELFLENLTAAHGGELVLLSR